MAGYAQKEMVSLDVKDVKLETVFQSIQEQTGYKIFYNNELVNATQLVTIQVTNVPLDTALRKLLTPLNLTYKTVDKTIVISKEAPVKTGVKTVELFEITGTVRDQQGEILQWFIKKLPLKELLPMPKESTAYGCHPWKGRSCSRLSEWKPRLLLSKDVVLLT